MSAMPDPPALDDHAVESLGARLDQLADLTDVPGNLTRPYLGPAHRAAVDLLTGWMAAAGMNVTLDALATLRGRYDGERPDAPALVIGSHIDSVRNAGRYDGPLGVLAGLAMVERLARTGRRLPFALEIVAFGDEEGSRFPSTLGGSRALAGRFDPAILDEHDDAGQSRSDALRAFGCEPTAWAAARLPADTLGYLEVHIEQGPVLEARQLAVGLVTAINGGSRGTITVRGTSGHAGTVPMAMRQDALAAAAEVVLAVEATARAEPDVNATVGVLRLPHGAVNTIPGWAQLTYDLRSPSDARRKEALATLRAAAGTIARRRGVSIDVVAQFDAPAAPCDERLLAGLAAAARRCDLPTMSLSSGAGHDAMSFHRALPFAMLFVRCRAGISHNPAEFCAPADIEAGLRLLTSFVESFEPGGPA